MGDRINCLLELTTPVETDDGGIAVSDTLRFFTGDHPAAQFEQGTKQGGKYKCGACGCKENLFSDQAHSLCHTWRSLKELQSLATAGTLGTAAGILHPFDHLKVSELKNELKERGFHIEKGIHKEMLQKELDGILKGVTRVPALLITNPTQPLSSLSLDKYEVMASESLNDIKGHIMNLITELPQILPSGDTLQKCTHLIDNCLAKEKKSGADLR